MKSKYFVKRAEFHGLPKQSDFEIKEETVIKTLNDGELLTEALAISVDPYIRIVPFPVGQPVIGFQAARVLQSNVKEYPKGSIVMFHGGWKTINKVIKEEIWHRSDQTLTNQEMTHAVGVL